MTDHPRFQSIESKSDDRHHHYHGAPAVDFVLCLADWWLNLPRQRQVECRIEPLRASEPTRPSASTATQFLKGVSYWLALHQRRPNGEST